MSFDPYERLPKLHEMTLTSEDFTDGDRLPTRSVMEELGGKDELPQLSWSNVPEGTKTFALTCLDPDAPTGSGFWHMAAFNIPASVTSLPGGAVRWDTIDWEAFGTTGEEVETSSGTFTAAQVIVTAGSWTTQLLPHLTSFVEVRRIGLTWSMPQYIEHFGPDVFPVFMRDRVESDGSVAHWFGAPSLDGYSIKIGVYPEPWNTTISPDEDPAEYTADQLAYIGDMVTQCIPGLIGEPVRHSAHHDSFASNQMPIFDRLNNDPRVLFATGMHGNAFKFAPSYGKMLAEMATSGESSLWREEFSLSAHDQL